MSRRLSFHLDVGGLRDIRLRPAYGLSGRPAEAWVRSFLSDVPLGPALPVQQHWDRSTGLALQQVVTARPPASAPRRSNSHARRKSRGQEARALHILGEIAAPPRSPRSTLTATTARRWRSPANSACARSSPTATSAWASSTGALRSASRPREHLTTATTMYREMDMRFWLEQAEAEMKELEG